MKGIADKKKKQNIGEYIIYMYQMEDLLRAYEFNLDDIRKYVIHHYPVDEKEKNQTFLWFQKLAQDMETEGVKEKGHLRNTQILVQELAKIHWELLKNDLTYFQSFQKAKPHILKLLSEFEEAEIGNEIQLFINTVYGRLLARLKGREIQQEILEATEIFGELIGYLNYVYFERTKKN